MEVTKKKMGANPGKSDRSLLTTASETILADGFEARQRARIARRRAVAERDARIDNTLMAGACILLGAVAFWLLCVWAAI